MENETKTELELLKERATKLGITYSNNIGLETLREKVNTAIAPAVETIAPARAERIAKALERKEAKLNAEKLVRIRLV